MSWTRAVHLKAWADTQEARYLLPLLVRRLVRAVTPLNAIVSFPAYEQAQRPGFDGVVEVTVEHQYVPNGKSVWEMGTDRNPATKADIDYDKRTDGTEEMLRRDCVFVFVTPREWRNKDEWAETRRSTGQWKDVRVLDANDLEHWLDLCPGVDVWFATLTGRKPPGASELRARWDGLKGIADFPLSPRVFLASRDATRSELVKWAGDGPSSAGLSCASIGDGLDFLTALVSSNTDCPQENTDCPQELDNVILM